MGRKTKPRAPRKGKQEKGDQLAKKPKPSKVSPSDIKDVIDDFDTIGEEDQYMMSLADRMKLKKATDPKPKKDILDDEDFSLDGVSNADSGEIGSRDNIKGLPARRTQQRAASKKAYHFSSSEDEEDPEHDYIDYDKLDQDDSFMIDDDDDNDDDGDSEFSFTMGKRRKTGGTTAPAKKKIVASKQEQVVANSKSEQPRADSILVSEKNLPSKPVGRRSLDDVDKSDDDGKPTKKAKTTKAKTNAKATRKTNPGGQRKKDLAPKPKGRGTTGKKATTSKKKPAIIDSDSNEDDFLLPPVRESHSSKESLSSVSTINHNPKKFISLSPRKPASSNQKVSIINTELFCCIG